MSNSVNRPVSLPTAGIIPPMITPLSPDGTVDLDSVDSLVDFLLNHGATGILALGSCGENGALSRDQRLEVVYRASEAAAGRGPVMVGVPALGLADALVDAREYTSLGADALLVPAPFVFAHSPVELAQYFSDIAAASSGVPVIAYNVPGRTGVTLTSDLIRDLARQSVLGGIKDSSGDLEAQRMLAEATKDQPGFLCFSGSELCIDGVLLGGFHGAIPGLANPFIEFHVELARRAVEGDWPGASDMQSRICALFGLYQYPVRSASFGGVVVAVLKEALVQLGVIESSTIAKPFVQADDALRVHVSHFLKLADEVHPLTGAPHAAPTPPPS